MRAPEAADYARVFDEIESRCEGVVHLGSFDSGADEPTTDAVSAAQERGSRSVLQLVQALARTKWQGAAPRLWLVTEQAQSVGGEHGRLRVEHGPVWGMGNVIALEHPELKCVRLDIDATDDTERICDLLHAEIRDADGADGEDSEDQVALRGDRRFAKRLVRVAHTNHTAEPATIQGDGTYLITGGWGGLGLLTAGWLVERGARELVLLGRGAPSGQALERIQGWERAGARVRVVRADVANFDEMARMIAEIGSPLRGVVHAAGVLADGVLLEQTWERFTTVMAPKVEGAWNLHRLTRGAPLDFFVMYSSAASVFGSAGQANHAAANAFLDVLAQQRRAEGLPALSVNWGAWSEVGAAADGGMEARMSLQGMGVIAPRQGMELLRKALESGRRGNGGAAGGLGEVRGAVFRRAYAAVFGGTRRRDADLGGSARRTGTGGFRTDAAPAIHGGRRAARSADRDTAAAGGEGAGAGWRRRWTRAAL